MGLPKRKTDFDSVEAFLAWEDAQSEKHEFVDGTVFAMVGARRVHVTVAGNCFALLKAHLRGGPCRVFISDMKLLVAAADAVFYPDVMVTCHPEDARADAFMQHPRVLIEVLSEATAAYDRGEKFGAYRLLPDLQEYALVDPAHRTVEVFRRTDGGDWLLALSDSASGLVLRSLDFSASSEAVFEGLEDEQILPPGLPHP